MYINFNLFFGEGPNGSRKGHQLWNLAFMLCMVPCGVCAEVDEWEIAPTFSELFANTSITFLKDTVKAVSPSDSGNGYGSLASSASKSAGGTVFLDGGAEVDYDW